MTTIESEIEAVARPLIDEATLDRLMARVESEGLELLGPDGVLTELTSRIMNRAIQQAAVGQRREGAPPERPRRDCP